MATPTSYQAVVGDPSNSPVSGVPWVIDPQGYGRVAQRPLDWSGAAGSVAGGHFRSVLKTGLTTILAAGTLLASLRWSDTAHYFVLLGIRAWASISTAFGTAQVVDIDAIKYSGYTVADTGGTAANVGGLSTNKMRTQGGVSMGNSLVNDMRAASTTAVAAGTRTLDAQPFAYASFGNANGLGNAAEVDLYSLGAYDHPVTLGAGEGFAVRVGTTQGATGVVVYGFALRWAEVLAF